MQEAACLEVVLKQDVPSKNFVLGDGRWDGDVGIEGDISSHGVEVFERYVSTIPCLAGL